jgi:NAD(P)-dependent dehydrogenase (short-subunit alcohol dehydrogenase family)/acyl carrier protein
VYSNTTAAPHSDDADAIRQLLTDHLTSPVRFVEEIQAMYDAGCRIFVECGPGRVLTGLVSSCLAGKPHVTIQMDQPGRPGLLQLVHALAQLAVAGVSFYATRLFDGRVTKNLRLDLLLAESQPKPLSATAWLVSNGRAIPAAKFQDPAWSVLPPNPAKRTSGAHVLLKSAGDVTQAQPVAPAAFPPSQAPPSPGVAPATSAQPASQFEAVMQGHHRLMNKFLETHRNVMLASLQPQTAGVAQAAAAGAGAVASSAAAVPAQTIAPVPVVSQPSAAAVPAVVAPVVPAVVAAPPEPVRFGRDRLAKVLLDLVSQRTGYPAESLDMDLDLEADLGVDSIKRVEILSALQSESALPAHAMEGQIEALSKLKTLRAIVDWLEARVAVPVGAAVPAAAAPVMAKVTREDVSKILLELVSQRTGYPVESLDIDLDLEADLGVDSIKRVEIFSALQSESALPANAMEGQIEALSKLKTLRAIVDWLDARIDGKVDARATETAPKPQPAPAPAPKPSAAERPVTPVTRMTIDVADAPFSQTPSKFASFLLITSDGAGVAAAFGARLNELGIQHCIVDHSGTDLQDAASVAALVQSLREKHGPIGGLVHLMPLAPVAGDVETRTLLDLRSLYLLTRELEKDLRSDAAGTVIAATALGGAFGFGSLVPDAFFPGNGAISGFVKTVAREWPEVSARTVDFPMSENPQTAARVLAEELMHRDGNLEVGYVGGRRKLLRPVESRLSESAPSALKLDRDSVVLMTGGARGITAATAIELARASQPKLILVGRSPLPVEEFADIAGITDPRQLRAALMDRLQTGGQRVTPAVVEGMAKRVLIDREIRSNLAMLRALGSEVEYQAVDVTDAAAVAQLIDGVYRKYGRIDGVVHGAGLIEDKLIGDKTPQSFDRVVLPKVSGALALVRALRPESLQFLVFFSSVSARYGNRGQCDYAAANEFLNKLAVDLNRKWPGRVVSLNWGPWRTEGGMVSDELAVRFAKAGVELIEVPAGRQAFLRELTHGRKEDAEVLFGGPLTTQAKPAESAAANAPVVSPLGGTLIHSNGTVVAHIDSHPERHVFLQDHQIDGKPVLPMMAALEMLAAVAAASKPGASLTAIRNLRNLNGITYPDGNGRSFHVEGSHAAAPGSAHCLELALKTASSGQLHYRGRVEFGGATPAPPARLKLVNSRPFPLSLPEAYNQWLFHGPLLAGITDIVAMGDNGIIGRLKTVGLEKLIRPSSGGDWMVDPVITDSSLQLVLLWARATHDQTPLPSALDAYHHVHPLHRASEILCEIEIARVPASPTLHSRHVFYDQDNRLLGWMEGMESTMSKALNRISEKRVGVK